MMVGRCSVERGLKCPDGGTASSTRGSQFNTENLKGLVRTPGAAPPDTRRLPPAPRPISVPAYLVLATAMANTTVRGAFQIHGTNPQVPTLSPDLPPDVLMPWRPSRSSKKRSDTESTRQPTGRSTASPSQVKSPALNSACPHSHHTFLPCGLQPPSSRIADRQGYRTKVYRRCLCKSTPYRICLPTPQAAADSARKGDSR